MSTGKERQLNQITIRYVSPHLAKRLDQERAITGKSLNQLVLDLLEKSLGMTPDSLYDNGLGGLAGTWSDEEYATFEKCVENSEQKDEDPE